MSEAVLQRLSDWVRTQPMPSDPADLRPEQVPRVQTVEEQLLTAARIQRDVEAAVSVLPCAVCGCYVGSREVAETGVAVPDLPNVGVLRADGERTAELPRDGITHLEHDGVKYCLSPEGITSAPGQPVRLHACLDCWAALAKKKVPPRSLVRVDTGPWPVDDTGPLPSPTYVERLLLSSVTPSRRVVVLRPTSGGCIGGVRKKELVGHVVVVPATSVRVDRIATSVDAAFAYPDAVPNLPTRDTEGGSLQDVALTAMARVLREHKGNVSAAAKALGVSRNTIYRKKDQLPPDVWG